MCTDTELLFVCYLCYLAMVEFIIYCLQDMEGSMSATDVSNALGLSALKSRSWSIFKTSAIKGEGLDEAMDW